MARKRSSAARAVRHNFVTLVKKPFFPNLFQRPPFGFDKVIVIGNIGVVHIRPKADGLRKVLPHAFIFPNAFLALFDERFKSVLFNLLLAVQPEKLFNFKLNGQSVRVPACLADNLAALHRMVTRNHVLDNARQNMPDVRLSVRRRRTVVKRVAISAGAVFNALFEDFVVAPELSDFLLAFNKVQIGVNLVIHIKTSRL